MAVVSRPMDAIGESTADHDVKTHKEEPHVTLDPAPPTSRKLSVKAGYFVLNST